MFAIEDGFSNFYKSFTDAQQLFRMYYNLWELIFKSRFLNMLNYFEWNETYLLFTQTTVLFPREKLWLAVTIVVL